MPRIQFTDRTIKNLKAPKAGQVDYFDTSKASESGFGLRVSHKGTRTWFLKYVRDGRQQRRSLRTADRNTATYPAVSLSQARTLATAWRDGLRAEGKTPMEKRAADAALPSFKVLADRFIDEYAKPKKRSWEADQRVFEKYFEAWHERKPVDITRADMVERLQGIKQENGPIMANRCLAAVRKLYAWAIKNAVVDIPFNPFVGIDPPGAESERDRTYTDTEVRALWEVFGQLGTHGQVLRFALVTGQRLMECAGIDKSEIDGDLWTLPAARAKNKRTHVIPLSEPAKAILAETHKLSEQWAFPSPRLSRKSGEEVHVNAFTKTRAKVRDDAGVGDFQPHDLRRTCMTNITRLGFPRFIADRVANHVEAGVGRVYDRHDYLKEKTEALEAWARHLEAITGNVTNVVQLKPGA